MNGYFQVFIPSRKSSKGRGARQIASSSMQFLEVGDALESTVTKDEASTF